MSTVFSRYCSQSLPIAISGEGPYITDKDGRKILDACAGAAVSSVGHNDPRVVSAIKKQLDAIPYAHTSFFTSEPAEQLADKLVHYAPTGLNRVYFTSGGSEAVEAALKMARQYFVERGESSRHLFIARRQSYHGSTLGALSVGGNEWRRAPYSPLLKPSHLISPCYAYRDRFANEALVAYGQRVANELEVMLAELGSENVLAFIAEPVVGATAGAVAAVPGYFRKIREICDRHGILLILDEVMCGMGRTGTLFACEQDQVVPDMIAVAKGLGAGYMPIGGLLVQQTIFETFASGSGFFQHGHTYMGHPLACAASLAVQKVIEDDDLLRRVNSLSQSLFSRLRERFDDNEFVGDIRGRGLLIGIEVVGDRASKLPLPVSSNFHKFMKDKAFQYGLMCYPMAGTINGVQGHHILLAPPFIAQEKHLDELVDKLGRAFDDTMEKIKAELPLAQNEVAIASP